MRLKQTSSSRTLTSIVFDEVTFVGDDSTFVPVVGAEG